MHSVVDPIGKFECSGGKGVLCIVAVERTCFTPSDKVCVVCLLQADPNCLEIDSLSTSSSTILNASNRRPSSTVEELEEIVDGVLVELMQV